MKKIHNFTFHNLKSLGNLAKADNCQFAPGNWIGEESSESGCGGLCYVHDIQWTIEDFGSGTLAITRYYFIW